MSNDNTSSVQERAKPPPTASNLQPHSPPASDKMYEYKDTLNLKCIT